MKKVIDTLAAYAFTGTWKLNPAKSTFAKGKEVKELTAVATEQGPNSVVTVKGVAAVGKAISIKYTVPMKGGSINYTESAPPAGTTIVSKRVNANTIESTTTLNGRKVGTTRAVVSKDGKTLTMIHRGLDDKGKAVKNTEVYERQ